VNVLKSKSLLPLLFYAVIPFIFILILFRISKIAGVVAILAYLALILLANLNLIYRMKAQMEYGKGNLKEAERWFKKAAGSKKAAADILVSYGFVLFKEGKLEEAEKVLGQAVEKSRNRDERNLAKSNLALVVWKKGDLDKAFEMLNEVISEYKTTAVYGSLGYLAIEKGDLDEALKINLEAYEYNSDNAIILDNLAHLYHLRGETDKAGELFEKLMEKEPSFPEAYYDYGRYLEDAEDTGKAREMYQRALKCSFNFNTTITREEVQSALDRLSPESGENN
jgi:tetratricopeptide (TPR) repeat protein